MDNIAADSIHQDESIEEEFQTGEILTISGGHFVHDIYTGFLSPLLPVIIEKLSLSLTAAGSLNAILPLPALLNPFIGYLADRISLRYFIILAPAVTATLISLMGLVPSYLTLALLLFTTGFSVAAFHAPAPAMIGRISGNQVGKGMSFFMASGELARTVSPLIAVWAVSLWTLDGIYRTAVLGWATSLVLFWRLHSVSARPNISGSVRTLVPVLRSVFPPLLIIVFFRNFLNVGLTTYLPTYMKFGGASLWVAGAALSIFELAGVVGALSSGTLSDRLGRKPVLLVGIVSAAALMMIFLNVEGWLIIPSLLALGFTSLSTPPVLMAIVQEHLPNNRALGNGLFLSATFLIRPLSILTIGYIGDTYDLRTAYYISALISLLAIPAIFKVPDLNSEN
ncbi:MAG: MFS transporter [Anaerolineales bacterium]|jgi:FSR family fosmidomycin resistance protein-like MFS transporter